MNIQIKDHVGLSVEDTLKVVQNMLKNKPKEGSFDYLLETFGVFDNISKQPIIVRQTNTRKSDKSPIVISIEPHTPLGAVRQCK
jgi:hypothetical protein